MKFYILRATGKAIGSIESTEYSKAERVAFQKYGRDVMVLDEKMYKLTMDLEGAERLQKLQGLVGRVKKKKRSSRVLTPVV